MTNTLEQALLEATQNEAATKTHWKQERQRLRNEIAELDVELQQAQRDKRDAIIEARNNGMPVARVARLAKVTRQRIYQIMSAA